MQIGNASTTLQESNETMWNDRLDQLDDYFKELQGQGERQ